MGGNKNMPNGTGNPMTEKRVQLQAKARENVSKILIRRESTILKQIPFAILNY